MRGTGLGDDAHGAFVTANTRLLSVPEAPDIDLYLADEITPLWQRAEAAGGGVGIPPPFWAFAWPGCRAFARLFIDRPSLVAGRHVLDVAAGCGLAAFAAKRAGAASVTANDIDPYALAAVRLAAARNNIAVTVLDGDLTSSPVSTIRAETVLVGDICYEEETARCMLAWLGRLAAAGKDVYLADPGRKFAPAAGARAIARYTVDTSLDLETTTAKETVIWRILGPCAAETPAR